MTPEFAQAVDPIFLHVVDLLERIGRGGNCSISEERSRILALIDRAESILGRKEEWELAKYALVAWIDDMLITNAPWDRGSEWAEDALEVYYFGSRLAFKKFYVMAEDAGKLQKKDALEVFYVCALLGFKGVYGDHKSNPADSGFPPTQEEWARKVAMAIVLGLGRPRIGVNSRPGVGAPPLEGKFNLVGMSIVAVILTAAAVMMAKFVFGLFSETF